MSYLLFLSRWEPPRRFDSKNWAKLSLRKGMSGEIKFTWAYSVRREFPNYSLKKGNASSDRDLANTLEAEKP